MLRSEAAPRPRPCAQSSWQGAAVSIPGYSLSCLHSPLIKYNNINLTVKRSILPSFLALSMSSTVFTSPFRALRSNSSSNCSRSPMTMT
ncbi:hypothetical protein E2C01_027515 [Portunus trituberculatus]|uniref:Uncharacterized protein n=1 Tax=Portunus trituberculatus TaxID=210409 RepID=A0A5B7ELI5_PORTR|nr:hypothetical protein [Portunus trituberculatus]